VTPVLLDVESRSRADIRRGGRLYWLHPSSEILVLVWYDTRDESVGVWHPGEPWPHEGRVLAAHNAMGFDRFALERNGIFAKDWIDTANLARKAGLPGALDELGKRWCGVPKDKEASKYTRQLSAVARPPRVLVREDPLLDVACPHCGSKTGEPCTTPKGKPAPGGPHKARQKAARVWYEPIPADEWKAMTPEQRRERGAQPDIDDEAMRIVTEYCASDVAIMVDAWPRLTEWLHVDDDAERLDRVVNDRGVCFDSALALRLLDDDSRVCEEAIAAVARETHETPDRVREIAQSPSQFCAATGAENAQAATVETMTHPLAKARMALASIARGKLQAGLDRVHDDGRLRDTMRYYGGHTGRWSSTGMQLHNMPRPDKCFEDVSESGQYPALPDGSIGVDAFADDVLRGRRCNAKEIELLVRACITASPGHLLAVADYSSIEARGTAWAAGDEAALDVFRSNRDPYIVAAAAIYGIEYEEVTWQRKIGKVSELACGYGGGPAAFEAFAKVYRVDLSTLDLPEIVSAWRTLHAPIQALWRSCERAFRLAIGGRITPVGSFNFVRDSVHDAIALVLPSGRPIVYNEPRISEDTGLSYHGARGRVHIYGGKIVENAIQAMCRDLMASAMVRAEAAGLRPVLTVHDEIVCDVPADRAHAAYDELCRIMRDAPKWAAGFPVEAKGWVGFRYRK